MSLCTSELSGEPVFPRTRDMYSRTPVPTGFQQTSEKRRIILVSDMLPTSLVRTATSSLMPHLYPSTCSTSSASLSTTSPAPSSLVQTEVNSSGVATVRKCCFVTMRLQFPLYQVKLARAPVNSLNLELLQVEIMDIPQFHHFSIQYNCTECLYI